MSNRVFSFETFKRHLVAPMKYRLAAGGVSWEAVDWFRKFHPGIFTVFERARIFETPGAIFVFGNHKFIITLFL